MVELNHRERTVKIKVVYYGPPLGGKTTNLQVLHQYAQAARRGELISINSAQDRTILFDLLPVKAGGFRGFDLRLQALAVPGQAMYAATRRLVLKNADAVVFVANSAVDRWEENIQSFREMTQNLLAHQLEPASMPLILQYNKRDLPDVTALDYMDRTLNARKVDSIPAVAVRGEGVLETFSAVLVRAMQDLASRYQIIETRRGQNIQQWTQQTITDMFGTTSLAGGPSPPALETPPPPAATTLPETTPPAARRAPERHTVRIAMPEEALRMAATGPDARANETLVESYAQASSHLSVALIEIRDERDVARRRLEDLQHVIGMARELARAQPADGALESVLLRLTDAVGAAHGSFLVRELDGSLRARALHGLTADPLLRTAAGTRYLGARLPGQAEPRVHQATDSLDLADALEAQPPRFGAVTMVPVGPGRESLGVAMLYHLQDAALPGEETLAHLAVASRALSTSLELTRVLGATREAERSLQLALAGTASVHGLREVVGFLEDLRDQFATLRRRPDIPPWFLGEFLRLAPGLAGALTTARALLGFSRGEVAREAVSVDDLIAELQAQGISCQQGPGAGAVLGDAVLLRLALKALVDRARRSAARTPEAVRVQTAAEGGRLLITVIDDAAAADEGASAGTDLSFAKRVAELHGGSLGIETREGVGSRLTLSLPAA